MQVVFIQNVKGVAHKGEIKNVKDGYFNNYLFPNKLAVLGTPDKLKQAEEIRKRQVIERERIASEAKDIKTKLEGMSISITRKSHDEKLYAAITEKDLIDEIQKKTNVRLGKDNIVMEKQIKKTGNHTVKINLTEGISCEINLEIKGEK